MQQLFYSFSLEKLYFLSEIKMSHIKGFEHKRIIQSWRVLPSLSSHLKRKNWDLTLKWMSSFLKYFTSAEWIIYYHLVSKHQHGKIKHDMHSQYQYFRSKIRQKNCRMSVIKCIICPTWSFLLSAGNWWQ